MIVSLRNLISATVLAALACQGGALPTAPRADDAPGAVEDDLAYYTCSMHPSVRQPERGACPLCGMDLTPVTRRDVDDVVVFVTPQSSWRIGLHTVEARVHPLALTIRAPGRVQGRLAGGFARVDLEVPARDLMHLAPGQAVRLLGDGERLAHIESVENALDATGTIGRAILRVPDVAMKLRTNAVVIAEVNVDLGKRLQIPASAVIVTGRRRLVFIEGETGGLEPRTVQLGARGDNAYEVVAGLLAGDKVAVSGTFLPAAESRIHAPHLWDQHGDVH